MSETCSKFSTIRNYSEICAYIYENKQNKLQSGGKNNYNISGLKA